MRIQLQDTTAGCNSISCQKTPSKKLPFRDRIQLDQLPCGNLTDIRYMKATDLPPPVLLLQSNQKSLWSIDPITIWYNLLFFPSLSPVFSASDSTKTQWAIDSLQTCWKILANIWLFYSFQVCKFITSWQGSCILKDFGETLEIPSKFIIIPMRPRMLKSLKITLRRSKGLPRQLRNDWNWVTNGQDQKGHVDARDIESTHGAEISTTPWGHLWRAEQSVGSPWCQNMRSNSELQRIFIWNEDPQSLSYDVTSVLKGLHVFQPIQYKFLGQALRSDSKGPLQRHSLGAGDPNVISSAGYFCRQAYESVSQMVTRLACPRCISP